MASFQFRVRTAVALVALSTVSVLGASSFMAGCSSSSDSSTPDAASQVCPTTLATSIGVACTTDREVCIVGFVCPQELNGIATCTCGGGTWGCNDHAGNPITDPTAGAACTALGPGNDKQCPADENTASFAGCTTPGLICSYPGDTCAGPPPVKNTDTCQCNGAGDGGLQYVCEPNTCPGPVIDSGPPVDAG